MLLKHFALACLCAGMAACGASKPRERPAVGAGTGTPLPHSGPTAYSIDGARSELRLLVYRAGPMARLGHNHVILNRAVHGWVDGATRPESASFLLIVPVADFVVDDARARSEEGRDFAAEVPEEAKAGTRHNLLGPALLDAERFPNLTIASVSIERSAGLAGTGNLAATVAINVAGHRSSRLVPFVLTSTPERLSAEGTVVLRQSELGLTPFSVMLGALQVQDEITVRFSLVAVAANAAAGP
jgi:hypothetical protein